MRAKIRKVKAAVKKAIGGAWETISAGGFPPIWKPTEKNEYVCFIPAAFHLATIKSGKRKTGSWLMHGVLTETNSENFYQGSGKAQTMVPVGKDDLIALPLSASLEGAGRLGVRGKGKKSPEFTPIAKAAIKKGVALRVVYLQTIPIGGGQEVKRFLIQAPLGLRKETV